MLPETLRAARKTAGFMVVSDPDYLLLFYHKETRCGNQRKVIPCHYSFLAELFLCC